MDMVAYGENYNLAMQGIEDMLLEFNRPMEHFKRDRYQGSFESYYRKYSDVIKAVEQVYLCDENPDGWIEKLSAHLIDKAQKELNDIPKKGARSQRQVDFNMILAIFIFPAILEYKGQSAEPLTDKIIEDWNRVFKMNLGKASFEKIENGFQKKMCYITTAVCESLGKPDDCYELTLLRDYRDHYLMQSEEGAAIVQEYYNIAPTIVTRINKEANAGSIYETVWTDYLSPCIKLIEEDKKEECKSCYMDMVYELKGRYMA